MTILKNINGVYHSNYKFIINFLLRFSSTGLYRNDKTMLNLIKSDANQMKNSLEAIQGINSVSISYKSKHNTQKLLKNAVNEISLFCDRFYHIQENGGSFGKDLISKNILKSVFEILKLNIALESGKETTKCLKEIINISNNIVEFVEQNHQKINTEYKNKMSLFYDGMFMNRTIHCL